MNTGDFTGSARGRRCKHKQSLQIKQIQVLSRTSNAIQLDWICVSTVHNPIKIKLQKFLKIVETLTNANLKILKAGFGQNLKLQNYI